MKVIMIQIFQILANRGAAFWEVTEIILFTITTAHRCLTHSKLCEHGDKKNLIPTQVLQLHNHQDIFIKNATIYQKSENWSQQIHHLVFT